MAVTNEMSEQAQKIVATPPLNVGTFDWHGRARIGFYRFVQGAVAGDADSTMRLFFLPNRPVRLLMAESWLYHAAFGAGRTLDVGWEAYVDEDGSDVPANLAGLATGLDVAAAGTKTPQGVVGEGETKLFKTKGGVWITAQVKGQTIPAGTVLEGVWKYAAD